jgi:hypothetical protein
MALFEEILHFVVKAPHMAHMYSIPNTYIFRYILPSLNLHMAVVAAIFKMAAFCAVKRYISVNTRNGDLIMVSMSVLDEPSFDIFSSVCTRRVCWARVS